MKVVGTRLYRQVPIIPKFYEIYTAKGRLKTGFSDDLLFRFRLSFWRSGKFVWRKRVGMYVGDLYLIQKSDLPKLHSISV